VLLASALRGAGFLLGCHCVTLQSTYQVGRRQPNTLQAQALNLWLRGSLAPPIIPPRVRTVLGGATPYAVGSITVARLLAVCPTVVQQAFYSALWLPLKGFHLEQRAFSRPIDTIEFLQFAFSIRPTLKLRRVWRTKNKKTVNLLGEFSTNSESQPFVCLFVPCIAHPNQVGSQAHLIT